jgi:hypothetical protein
MNQHLRKVAIASAGISRTQAFSAPREAQASSRSFWAPAWLAPYR